MTPRLFRLIIVVAVLAAVLGAIAGDCVRAWLARDAWQQIVWMAA